MKQETEQPKRKKNGGKKYRAFSDFKTQAELTQVLGIKVRERLFTPGKETAPVPPSDLLTKSIERAQRLPLHTKKIIAEGFLFPVLVEVYQEFQDRISFFSGVEWKVGGETPLGGFCDYIIGGLPEMSVPEAPMICVVEAKKEDFDGGSWQCAAELYACKIANEKENIFYPFYFGCVSIGTVWKFVKFDCESMTLYRDTFPYSTADLPQLLGVWRWVLNEQLASRL